MAEFPNGDLELSELALGTLTVPRWRLHTERASVWLGMTLGVVFTLVLVIVAVDAALYDASVYNLLLFVLSVLVLTPALAGLRRARRVHNRIYVELPGERPGPVVNALESGLRGSFLEFSKEWVGQPAMGIAAIGLWSYAVEGFAPDVYIVDCGHRTLVCIGPAVSATGEQVSRLANIVSRVLLRTHGPLEGPPARRHVWPRRR